MTADESTPAAGPASTTAKARELLDAGDIQGVLRQLRFNIEEFTLPELAETLRRAAEISGFTELAEAAAAVAADPERPQALYDFGYACIERGVSYLAIPPLREALRLAPGARLILAELVTAYEGDERHQDVVALLAERDAELPAWPERYLLAHNTLMIGDVPRAATEFGRLPVPDEEWQPARERLARMLTRAEAARSAGAPLDRTDLRGWHFTLTGGLLTTLSPYGFAEGMTGRYAYTQDDYADCHEGLRRLRLVLTAAGRKPSSVALLPDRSSRILGLAAAEYLEVPAAPYRADRRENTLVVAYDLNSLAGRDDLTLLQLKERAPGELLFEHATCWTGPPVAAADISTFLHQFVVPPWGERLRAAPPEGADAGPVREEQPDTRTDEALATAILQSALATPSDSGDGATPPDPPETPATLAAAVAPPWATTPRDQSPSPGPVRSARF